MKNNLFEDFQGISPQAWKQKIQVDLKGADYNKTLLWKTQEGIIVKPFYTKEDRTNRNIIESKKGFKICQSIFIDNEKVANSLALTALKKGATAIHFSSKKVFDFKKVLKDINLKDTLVYFNFSFLFSDFTQEVSTFCNSENVYFNIDIIGNLANTGNWYFNLKEDHQQLERIVKEVNNSICINASIYQNAGANNIQQLAYALAHANEYLNHFGKDIAKKIHFNFSVGGNYFFEISKLRAFRILWQSLLKEYGTQNAAQIFAQPSLRNKTLYDYNVNMLRTTSECMSAILGGANVISNISYDAVFHKSNEFGERISRNQLLITQLESELSEAQNIADGTFFIEAITEQLAEKSLEVFKLIEKGGGFLKQLKSGIIQKKITETATKEQAKFDTDELVLLGSNKIKNPKDLMKENIELYPFIKIRNQKTLIQPIIQKRIAEKLEKERLDHE